MPVNVCFALGKCCAVCQDFAFAVRVAGDIVKVAYRNRRVFQADCIAAILLGHYANSGGSGMGFQYVGGLNGVPFAVPIYMRQL